MYATHSCVWWNVVPSGIKSIFWSAIHLEMVEFADVSKLYEGICFGLNRTGYMWKNENKDGIFERKDSFTQESAVK